ncbi:glycosyltransferase family 39 protein [Candidatus Woesearchaeota archaeon]|nr:glycosyltransferase family 39 protein [Candidatus Woesearchaeota archaeon]
MKKDRGYIGLVALVFLVALALRLYLAFQTPYFEVGEAYFNYAQVDSIQQTLLPSYFEEGEGFEEARIFPPVYHYILAFFASFMGVSFALKIVPNVLACLLVIIIYFMVLEITKNRKIALFSSFVAAFIPVFFGGTVNSASILSFTLPLIFYLMYCFMRIKERAFLYQFLLFAFVLSLTSAISFLFVFALLIYMLLIKLEYKLQNRMELEVILFVTFLTLWVNSIIYKNAFLFHSYSLIWQNLPSQILAAYFKDIDIVASVTSIGIVPLILGVYAVYRYMFKERDRRTYFLMAFALTVAILLWFKLITLDVGLMFLGAVLIPLMAQALGLLFRYIEMTKISSYGWAFWLPLVVIVVLSSFLPSVARASVSISDSVDGAEIDALLWVREQTPEGSVVLSTISEGNLVSAVAARKNVADDDFILVRSSDILFDDVQGMYTSLLKTNAVELLSKYGVDYIYFSPRAKAEFGIESLKYAEKDCFEPVYDEEVKIYKVLCEIRSD